MLGSINSAGGNSLSGMNAATASLNTTARRIASLATPEGDKVSLSDEMVSMLNAKRDFQANVKAFQAQDETTQSLLNVFG